MSIQLTGADVIDLAVQTEVRGERFYRQAAANVGQGEARELFIHLANEEVRHKQVFAGLSSAIVVTDIDSTTWDEAIAYIEATVDHEFFGSAAPIRAIPLGETVGEMIHQAMGFEKQTLLFFYGLRDLVQSPNRPLLDGIIGEEKMHIRRLADMLGTLR